MSTKLQSKFPKGETLWVTYRNSNNEVCYAMTSNLIRDTYYLYEMLEDGSVKKLGKNSNPNVLEDKYSVFKKIGPSND